MLILVRLYSTTNANPPAQIIITTTIIFRLFIILSNRSIMSSFTVTLETPSSCIRVGMDSRVPTVLDSPESRAMMARAKILPRARSLRLRGVTSRVAMVPRSFSPAMDSGATAAQPE